MTQKDHYYSAVYRHVHVMQGRSPKLSLGRTKLKVRFTKEK